MNLQNLSATVLIEGDVLRDAVLHAQEMCSINFARDDFDRLVRILIPLIAPMMCCEEIRVAAKLPDSPSDVQRRHWQRGVRNGRRKSFGSACADPVERSGATGKCKIIADQLLGTVKAAGGVG